MEPSRDFGMEPFRSVPSGSQTEHILREESPFFYLDEKVGRVGRTRY
jgi:hypothetical protein